MPTSVFRLILRPLSMTALLVVLATNACAEDDASPPPPAPCGTKDAPQSCTCARSNDCWIDFCCLPSLSGGENQRVAYETFPPAACLPR